MCRLLRRMVCALVAGTAVFLVIALWSGGEKFRWFGEKTGGAIKESGEKLGEKADEIKEKKDAAARQLHKLTGADENEVNDKKELEGPKQHKKIQKEHKGTTSKAESPEDIKSEDSGASLHSLWSRFLAKIKGFFKKE